jgi:hypothetical protein
MSKFAKIFFSRIIVGVGSLFASLESAETNFFAVTLYPRHPFFMMWTNALEARSIVCAFSTIAPILSMCASAKIVGQIVERVAVFVVGFHSIRRARNDAVHINMFSLSKQLGRISRGIKGLCVLIVECIPLVLVEFLVPIICYLRNLALCKLNSFHFFLIEIARPVWVEQTKQANFTNYHCGSRPADKIIIS